MTTDARRPVKLSDDQERRARELHQRGVVIDSLGPAGPPTLTAHQLQLVEETEAAGGGLPQLLEALERGDAEDWQEGGPEEYWTEWEKSGVTASSFTLGAYGARNWTYENAIRDLAEFLGRIDRAPRLLRVRKAEDVERAKRDGRLGLIFNFQNTDHLNGEMANLDLFYKFGLRIIQLTYNARNVVGEGCTERTQGGLSHFGVDLVRRMNELGVLVDVSHCGEGTTLDAIEHSSKPVAVTHAMAAAICDHPRGKTDSVIKELGQAEDSYFGIVMLPFFLSNSGQATLDDWLRHIEHVANLIGIDRVGIGTDTGGTMPAPLAKIMNREFTAGGSFGLTDNRVDMAATTTGFESWSRNWPDLTRALVGAGYDDDEILGIIGGNFLRVLRTAIG